MKKLSYLAVAGLLLSSSASYAAGELHIYNWGNYTNPDLIKKFEKAYDVKVTLDTFDSNESMMAKIKAGNSGYDIVVPSDYAVQIMKNDGLLEATEPSQMENFKNMKPEMVHLYFDDGRHYSVPWQVGITTFDVDTAIYKGDVDTWSVIFNPPAELKGRINVLDDMVTVMHALEHYKGFKLCTSDKSELKQMNDILVAAKPSWRTFSYDAPTLLSSKDVDASMIWDGAGIRARANRATLKLSFPKEGAEGFVDNVAVLKGASNIENAKLFQNFIMDPENAAMISNFATYNNGIMGSEKFMKADMTSAPELNPPAGFKPEFNPPCSPQVIEFYNKIWTNLRK
jgi:spermidine/putrescine transport system substrate-binding protein